MQEVLDNKHCTNGDFDLDFDTAFTAYAQAEVFTAMGFEVTKPLCVDGVNWSIRVSK